MEISLLQIIHYDGLLKDQLIYKMGLHVVCVKADQPKSLFKI